MNAFAYTIDAEDRIVSLSADWDLFARENQASDSCLANGVINRQIWEFIRDLETRHLYLVINANVRASGKAVTIPFRCDAPDRRRCLEMNIAPVKQKHIEYQTTVLWEEPREPVALLMAESERSDELLRMCSMCKKVHLSDDSWVEVEAAVARMRLFDRVALPRITHGICPKCYTLAMAEIKEYFAGRGGPA